MLLIMLPNVFIIYISLEVTKGVPMRREVRGPYTGLD
jgi:hypothetical protein